MMKFRRSGIIVSLLIAALIVSGAVFYLVNLHTNPGKSRMLEILDTGSGKVYGRWPLEETGEFAIEFIHSVNQSPVREFFGIDDKVIHKRDLRIRTKAVRFSSFGAGMMSDLEPGMSISQDGDAMVITGFNTSHKELNYIVGTVSDHVLFINGDTVSLQKLCGKNARITIRYNAMRNTGGKK